MNDCLWCIEPLLPYKYKTLKEVKFDIHNLMTRIPFHLGKPASKVDEFPNGL